MAASRAPGQLGLVQDFVNTFEIGGDEKVGSPAELESWLREVGLLRSGSVTAIQHKHGLQLREALRRLLIANNDGRPDGADLAVLNAVAGQSGLRPTFLTDGQVRLEPGRDGGWSGLGRLVAAVSDAMNDGTWSRLKVCAEDDCRWAFYDRSKNRSGHWCTMEVCGNRAKARQFRQRRRSASQPNG
jgi:predicted RNA-binding Zn ribbon-like protein